MRRRIPILLVALLFVGVSATIDFFHTETDGQFNPQCPACQFHVAAIGEQAAAPGCLPLPVLLATIPDVLPPDCTGLAQATSARPRAPPAS